MKNEVIFDALETIKGDVTEILARLPQKKLPMPCTSGSAGTKKLISCRSIPW